MSHPPVVIAVHGTFAGTATRGLFHWWQSGGPLAACLDAALGEEAFAFESFIWSDKRNVTGPNRESERRRAGRQLLRRLQELEVDGRSYHLVGHSHGGSVIWHALKASAAQNRRLRGLRSWSSVSTPFLDFGPDGSVWWRVTAAMAATVALYWMGFWALVGDFVTTATTGGLAAAVAKLPMVEELPDIEAALGGTYFFVATAIFAALAGLSSSLLLLPLNDVRRYLWAIPREHQIERRAAQWYASHWFGIAHPHDEAINGLKATLVRAPDLVLRDRPGIVGALLRVFGPLATATNQFAWGVLMRNAQGCDLSGLSLHRAAATPRPFKNDLVPVPEAVAARITARADRSAASVLARFRNRLETISDQADVVALMGVLSGDYDDASLIHTTMFEDEWVCTAIAAHLRPIAPEAPVSDVSALTLRPRFSKATYALNGVKALLVAGAVATVAVAANFGYYIYIYPETNLAAGDRILERFNEPAFIAMADGRAAGHALVRARRLGATTDDVWRAATKLRESQAKSEAYQLIARELALRDEMTDMVRWVTSPPATPVESMLPYRQVDHLSLSLTAALELLAGIGRFTEFIATVETFAGGHGEYLGVAMARKRDGVAETIQPLLAAAAIYAERSLSGSHQSRVLLRLIPAALTLRQWETAVDWAVKAFIADRDCKGWDRMVAKAALVVTEPAGVAALESVINVCAPANNAEDKRRLLRRNAANYISSSSCELAAPMMRQASVHRTDESARIPAHFIKCLAINGRRDDAERLVAAYADVFSRTTTNADPRAIWTASQTLRKAGLTAAATKWAGIALKLADRPEAIEEKQMNTDVTFANDAIKLEVLKQTDGKKLDAFLNALASAGRAFDNSRSFPDSWARLRAIHAKYADSYPRSCVMSTEDIATIAAIVQIAAYYPEKNPSSLALSALGLANHCKLNIGTGGLLDHAFSIVSGDNDAARRARNVAGISAYQPTLRTAFLVADKAALPAEILNGYVAAVDALRPKITPVVKVDFDPLRYEPIGQATSR